MREGRTEMWRTENMRREIEKGREHGESGSAEWDVVEWSGWNGMG